MLSGIPTLMILSEEQKFNGENLLKWATNMTQLLGSKGLLGYVNGQIAKPAQPPTGDPTPDPMPVYSTTPSFDEWTFRNQLARGHVTLNCTDVASLGVTTTGTAKEAWDSIQDEWGKSTDMRRSHAQEQLNRTVYAEGMDIQEHVKLLRTRKAAVDNLSTAVMTDETWRGVIIRFIPPTLKWLSVIPSLYMMTTSADVISTLLAHGMILDRGTQNKPSLGSTNTVLIARTTDGCTNPNCKAKKRSTHTTANCYWPGGGKEGQFPPNFGQRTRANIAASHQDASDHFVLSVCVSDTPGNSGVLVHDEEITGNQDITTIALVSRSFQDLGGNETPTFMDSGASNTMFVSRDVFVDYKVIPPRMGDSAKAVDGDFDIVGEGTVVQRYLVDGKEKKITYICALHAPMLNANLISVGAFDRAGLTTTFGHGHGVIRKGDGTAVLTGCGQKGMYVVEPLVGDIPDTPRALTSLSHVASLEQWHRRLAHCSPSTIQEMISGALVEGLEVSGNELRGKCKDCVLGQQTRCPFDGATEKDIDPLVLVSFDLWGPSRVPSSGGKMYFMPVVDAGTFYKHGAYLSDKSDLSTIAAFDNFRIEAESLTGRKIRRLRTDCAFESAAWGDYCRQHDIVHEFTAPYSSAQNGLAERAIRTTMDDVRTLLRDSGLSHSYWAEAAAYSVAMRNLIPSRRHPGRILLESFSGRRQDVSHLWAFGAKCWATIPTVHGVQVTGGSKLDPHSVECRFLGYASGSGNYKVQEVMSCHVLISRDVVFEEGQPHRTSLSVGENIPLFDILLEGEVSSHDKLDNAPTTELTDRIISGHNNHGDPDPGARGNQDNHPDPDIPTGPTQQDIEPRWSSRISQPLSASLQSKEYQRQEATGRNEGDDWATNRSLPHAKLAFDRVSVEQDSYITCLMETKASHNIPHSYCHAMNTDLEHWLIPIQVEMDTLKAKHTWDLVKPPPGANIMDSMWVYDIKWDGEGNRIKDKARLIGKGYTQQLGIDYNETWAGVT